MKAPDPRRRVPVVALAAAALAAVSGPASGAAAPGCDRPLSKNDLDALDSVADGRLYLAELPPGAVDCLVDRLVRTKDAKVRGAFRAFIQNDVWEALRARLRALEKDDALPADVRRRVADLRATDYSDARLFVGGQLLLRLENERTATSSAGARERFVTEIRSLRLGASADGAFDLGRWKIAPALSAFGDALWSADRLDPPSGPSTRDDRSYLGAGGDAALSVLRRDERVNLSAYGSLSGFRDPPPRRSMGDHSAGGSAKAREIGGSAFGLEASADWYADDAAPLGAAYFDPRYEELFLHGEAAYMWKAAGLLATYDHKLYDDVATVYDSRYASDAGSLVLHLPAGDESYVRIALGGGAWDEELQLLGGEPGASAGGEIHAKTSGDLRLARAFRADFAGIIRANVASGTFEGWYPSGEVQLGATIELGDLRLRATGKTGGERRVLNREQRSWYAAVVGDAAYAPKDFFNLVASGAWQAIRQDGYDAYDDDYWRAGASVGVRVSRKLDVWLWTEGKLTDERIAAGGFDQGLSYAMIAEKLTLRY